MVKVFTKGGHDRKAVGRHLSYLSRDGMVEIETDDGRHLNGQGVEQELLEDWDLDLEEARRTSTLTSRPGIAQPKLVHKVVFSMPAGTPADGLFRGAQAFARETFGAKHRYAMVLHTDEPHPHVHMVIKASRICATAARARHQCKCDGQGGTGCDATESVRRDVSRDSTRCIPAHLGAIGSTRRGADDGLRGLEQGVIAAHTGTG